MCVCVCVCVCAFSYFIFLWVQEIERNRNGVSSSFSKTTNCPLRATTLQKFGSKFGHNQYTCTVNVSRALPQCTRHVVYAPSARASALKLGGESFRAGRSWRLTAN